MHDNAACPRCLGTDIQPTVDLYRPPVFLTPSGLMLTEEALRQIVGASIPSAEEAEQAIEELMRLLENFEGQDNDLLDVIARSMDDPSNKQPPPASDAAIHQLRTTRWRPNQQLTQMAQEECGICLAQYEMVCTRLFLSSPTALIGMIAHGRTMNSRTCLAATRCTRTACGHGSSRPAPALSAGPPHPSSALPVRFQYSLHLAARVLQLCV